MTAPLKHIAARISRDIRHVAYRRTSDGQVVRDSGQLDYLIRQANLYRERLMRLAECKNDTSAFNTNLRALFDSFGARVLAAARAANQKLPATPSPGELETLANMIDVDRPAHPRGRKSEFDIGGKVRRTTDWAAHDYAAQVIMADALRVCMPRTQWAFSIPHNGGREAFIARLCNLIREGYVVTSASDIANAYPSLRPGHLTAMLPIPDWALENVLFCDPEAALTETDTTTMTNRRTRMPTTAARGLSQGSVCSPAAMSVVVGNVLQPLAEGVREIGQYEDDILSCARSRPAVEHFRARLEEGFLKLAPEPLRLKRNLVVDLKEGEVIDFLGYRVGFNASGPSIYVRPCPRSWSRIEARLRTAFRDHLRIRPTADYWDLLQVAQEKMDGWKRSHGAWSDHGPRSKELEVFAFGTEVLDRYCIEEALPLGDLLERPRKRVRSPVGQ